jgi:hypothetical protein
LDSTDFVLSQPAASPPPPQPASEQPQVITEAAAEPELPTTTPQPPLTEVEKVEKAPVESAVEVTAGTPEKEEEVCVNEFFVHIHRTRTYSGDSNNVLLAIIGYYSISLRSLYLWCDMSTYLIFKTLNLAVLP